MIITYRRPHAVRECLGHLIAQSDPPDQIIVVDASEDHVTQTVVEGRPTVVYLRNPSGAGNMSNSRNAALRLADGDIIAFLDDDAYPEPSYVSHIRRAYADPTVGLACSRTLNGQPGEANIAPDGIGRLLANGRLSGNFAFDAGPQGLVDIDHGIGATMSFRRSTLQAMGGFSEDYAGVSGIREDTDAFLRARRLGFRAVFISDAVAHHVGEPQAKGRRFDLRYEHWTARNHALLLLNNFGGMNSRVIGSIAGDIGRLLRDRQRTRVRRTVRAAVALAGFLRGAIIAVRRHGLSPSPPRLTGEPARYL